MISIASNAFVSDLADIEDSIKGSKVVVGEESMIDSFVKIKMAGGVGDVLIGNKTFINSGVVIYSGHGVTIGDNVLVAANSVFSATNHEYRSREKKIIEQRFMESKGGIIIEDDVWIGASCVILDGAVIRKGAVVGAMSLVRGELEEYGIYGGNPIKLLGRRK